MLRSKFQFQETKISIRNIILKGGRNISKKGECKIYVDIIAFYADGTRKTIRIPTGVSVRPEHWTPDKNGGTISKNDPNSWEKELRIYNIFAKYVQQLTDREKGTWDDSFNPDNLVSLDVLFPKVTKTLTDYIDDYIDYRKSVNTPRGTLKEFTTCKNRLDGYEKLKGINLTFDDITLSFSDSFYSYLLKKTYSSGTTQIKKTYSSGTIHKTYAILITILNFFYERQEEYNIKLTDKFRSKKFKRGEPSINEPRPMSNTELTTLLKHTFENDTHNKMKERFLFQCSTGIRYSDMFFINEKNIKGEFIDYYPVKTRHKKDNYVSVPLNPLSRSILQKYNYDMTKLMISNQKYNNGLRDMFTVLIEKYPEIFKQSYTSHNGRDTFITNSLASKVDVPTLLKMVGQESYEVMKRYNKVSKELRIQNMALVKEYQVSI
jgi:site-specific recombinase XerD